MLLEVITLLNSLMVKAHSPSVNDCGSGWFGKGCVFQCHCSSSVTCGAAGECPNNGKCEAGYFGPGCQYVYQKWNTTSSNDQYLIDDDESTCNNHKNATDVTIRFSHGIVFTWFRLYVKYPEVLHNFSVLLDEMFTCPNERRYALSQTAVDVSCEVENAVLSLKLNGIVAPYVCSIYVNKGRNVALRQAANQSSTYTIDTADKAVDGNRSQIYNLKSCSHTKDEDYMAEWSLYFDRPYIVYSVVVYNREDYGDRLRNFTLMTYNEKRNVTNSMMGVDEKKMYVIQMNSRAPIVVLKIQQYNLDKKGNRILSLCEVEAYGEALCPDAYYGLSCDQKCKCDFSERCFTVTGECAPGCPIGEYGEMCTKYCSPECRTGFCYQRLGICDSCNPGFSGAYCTEECPDGKYGFKCNKSCSKYCNGVCDKISGWCDCQPPYTGNDCTECERGTYGVNCSRTCPPDCENILCDLETGKCMACSGLRTGDLCDECPEGTYGSSCSSNCSIYCQNGTCDPDNGTCPVCVGGYLGPRCRQALADESSWMQSLIAIVIASGIALLIVSFLLQKLCKKLIEAAQSISLTPPSDET